MADRRGIIVPLVILAFIFLSPDPVQRRQNQFNPGPTIEDVVAEERRSLSALQNSTYSENGLPSLNLTGLEEHRGYAWEALPPVRGRAKELLEYALGDGASSALDMSSGDSGGVPLYKNVTGNVHGRWVRSKLHDTVLVPRLNLSEYRLNSPFGPMPERDFGRNVTGLEGDVKLRFHEPQAVHQRLPQEVNNVTSMDVELTVTDATTFEEHELRLLGVYYPNAGQAVLTTTSDKFAGIFMLPHFAASEPMFAASRSLLNESITRTMQQQLDGPIFRPNPWSTTSEGMPERPFPAPQCELIMYLQQLPPISAPSRLASSALSFLERELRFPTGAFVPLAPDLRFSMLAFSPDCGYILESRGPPDYAPQDGDHFTGPKIEVLYNSSRNHLMAFTFALAFQLVLLMRQMREASTPSTRSRISFYTIAMLSLGDGFTTMTFLLISLFIGGLWVNLVATAFLAFISVSFFGMRFLMDIWTVQAPERARRDREEAEEASRREELYQAALQRLRDARVARLNAATALANGNVTPEASTQPPAVDTTPTEAAPISAPDDASLSTQEAPQNELPAVSAQLRTPAQPPPSSLPLPATAPRPTDTGASPVFMPSDQEDIQPAAPPTTGAQMVPTTGSSAQTFGSLYTRFYLLLLATLFLSLNAISWPAAARRIYFTGLGLIYLSFWIPQINRNVQRNCRHALNWEYVVGQSMLRLVPFAYFYGYEHNVLFAEVDYTGLALLATWIWFQVIFLVSQEIIGPRWFVGKGWAPPAYDYHPVLRDDEEGATMPIGFAQATDGSAPSSPVERRRSSSSPTTARRNSIVTKEKQAKGKRVFDCAICMQELEVPVIEAGGSGESGPAGLLARRLYMVTPCRHIFHSSCLEGWMKYRLQCPICRETLPPL